MGAAFDKWLAQPGTLHFLRRIVASDPTRPNAHKVVRPTSRIYRRYQAYVARVVSTKDERTGIHSDVVQYTPLRRGHADKFDAPELGLQMSLNAGVAILDKNGDSSQAFSELKFQSDVSDSSNRGKRLVDQPEHRDNFQLWTEVLSFRQRLHGLEGVMDVWRGMRKREVDFPVEGPEAEKLWTTFIDASVGARDAWKKNSQLSKLFAYAQDLKTRTGGQYQGLYKGIVGRRFRLHPQDVAQWHKRFVEAGLTGPRDLPSVVMDVTCASDQKSAFQTWLNIGREAGREDMYDIAIDEILKFGDPKLALCWHKWLMDSSFGPSTMMSKKREVQQLFEKAGDRSFRLVRSTGGTLLEAGGQILGSSSHVRQWTRASLNTFVGDAHGIKPKEISDSFCARLFATRAFSLDLVIRGLSFLSVDKLGPLTIKEMATRAGSPSEMNSKLKDLNKLGIRLGGSIFAQLVSKAACDGDHRLWKAILETDQHPDVYEDSATQEALATSFLQQQQLDQAHLSLMALSLTTPGAQHVAWNRVLQQYIVNREYDSAASTTQAIQNQGIPLTLYSLTLLRRYLLPERRRGRTSVAQTTTPALSLRLVRNACIHTASKGHYVPVNLWVELLKRFGMARRWVETERLVLWLFNHYTSRAAAVRHSSRGGKYLGQMRFQRKALSLRLIFSPVMLQALFTWGFRVARNHLNVQGLGDERPTCEPWARGLALLQQIQQRELFDVIAEARSSFQQRMWILFGTGYSTLEVNNLARIYNRISLAHYINHANEIWPGLIGWVEPGLLQESGISDPQLLVQFFGTMYRTKRSTSEYANVAQFAAHLSSMKHSHYAQLATIRGRERAWKNSTIRVLLPPARPNPDDNSNTNVKNESASPHVPLTADSSYVNFPADAPQEHQSPSARSSNWHPPPSPRYIPARP